MLHESFPWKQDLLRRRNLIHQYNSADKLENDNDDKAYIILEKAIFYSAFIIRKLIDCPTKMSDEVDNYKLEVKSYKPNSKKKFDIMNHWLDDNTHNWEHYTKNTVYARNICNWLIHSFFFAFCYGEDGTFDGFFVSSDYDKNKDLYYVNMSDWLQYIDFVASDDIVEMRAEYDFQKDEHKIILKRRGW